MDDFLKTVSKSAEMEQLHAGLRELSRTLFLYNKNLRDAGFSALDALQLTVAFQSVVMGFGGQGKKE